MREMIEAGLRATLLAGAVVILGGVLAHAQAPIMTMQGTLCDTPDQMAEVILATDDVSDDEAIEGINSQYNDPTACIFGKWAVLPIEAVASVRNQSGDHKIMRVLLFKVQDGVAMPIGEQFASFPAGGAP